MQLSDPMGALLRTLIHLKRLHRAWYLNQQHTYLIFKIKIYNIFHVQTFCEWKRKVKKNGWSCLWVIFHIDIYISTMVKKCSTWLKSNWDNKYNIFLAIPFLFFLFLFLVFLLTNSMISIVKRRVCRCWFHCFWFIFVFW